MSGHYDNETLAPATNQHTAAVIVLLASCLAMLAVGANSTAIMAALPTMRIELSLDAIGTQWAINAYLVVSASFIVLGGKAADLFGARQVSVAGLALFGIASCVIALANGATTLLAGRGPAGSRCRLRGPQHAHRRRHRRDAATSSRIYRCLERVLDAGFQYWPVIRWPAHLQSRLAGDILVEHSADVHRLRRPRDRTPGTCASRRFDEPHYRLARLRPSDHGDGFDGLEFSRPCRGLGSRRPARCHRSTRAGRRGVHSAADRGTTDHGPRSSTLASSLGAGLCSACLSVRCRCSAS